MYLYSLRSGLNLGLARTRMGDVMGSLQVKSQTDFSSGINAVTSPYIISPKQCLRVTNMILDEHGSLRTRDGTLLQTSSPAGEAGNKITKLYDYVQSNLAGTIIKLAIVKSGAVNKLYNRGTTPWTLIGTLRTGYDIPDIVTFAGNVYITEDDTNASQVTYGIQQYDGTTLGFTPQAPPEARHLSVHLGYLWAWGTGEGPSSTSYGQSSLNSSDVNNPVSWPAANQTFISKDDGQSAQGIGQFTIAEAGISPTAVQIAFKNFSAYQVSGVFGSSSFAVQKIKSDMGCVAPRTIQFVSGFGIIRLTHRGFALYDGVSDVLISEEIRPYLFGRDDITGLSWANVSFSVASQAQNPPLYVCACPIDGNGMKRTFIYDLVRKAWTIATYPNAISTIQLILDSGQLPVLLTGDFSANGVRRIFAGDADDDGTAIGWVVRVKPSFGSSPMDRAYYRRLITKFFDVQAAQVINVQFNFGPSQAARLQTTSVPVSTSLSILSGYGLSTYGTSPYGSVSSVQSLTDVDLPFDIGVLANNIIAEISGTGKARLRGIEWHLRSKPLTVPLGVH